MATGTAHGDFIAAATQSLGDDGVGAGPIERNRCTNCVGPPRLLEDVPHAPQVALALFAHIPDQQDRSSVFDAGRAESSRDGEQCGDPRAIVGDAGTVKLASLTSNCDGGSSGENRVEMRSESDERSVDVSARQYAEDVADLVLLNVGEAQCLELPSQPLRARSLTPGWGRNRSHLELQVFQFAAVGPKPCERLVYGPKLGQPGHRLLWRGLCARIIVVRGRHSTERRPMLRTKGHDRW